MLGINPSAGTDGGNITKGAFISMDAPGTHKMMMFLPKKR
jgi:hypothetical protein